VACLLPLFFGGGFWLLTAPPKHGITKANFDRIRVGMTESDVQAIFLVPPGDYLSGRRTLKGSGAGSGWLVKRSTWVSEEGSFDVFVDPSGKVIRKDYYEVVQPSALQSFRDWLADLLHW
jgi:hypothetical protein